MRKPDLLAKDMGNHAANRVSQMMTDQMALCETSEQQAFVAYAVAITAVAVFWHAVVEHSGAHTKQKAIRELKQCLQLIEQNILLTIKDFTVAVGGRGK